MRRLLLSLLTVLGVGMAFAVAPASSFAMNPASFGAPSTTRVPGSSGALSGAMTTADFSQDGHADVAVYDGNYQTSAQSLEVWSSTTSGGSTSWSWTPLTPPPYAAFGNEAVAAANLNPETDDHPDLLALGESGLSGDSVLAVYLGNGNGTFQTQIDTTLPGYANGLAVADVNGDGIPDVLIPTTVQNGIEWEAKVVTLIGEGNGEFEAPVISTVDSSTSEADVLATGIVVGRFTGGGSADIAVSQAFSPPNDVYVLKGDGSGSFTDPTPMSLGVGSFGLAAGDFDGDGKTDFALPVAVPGTGGKVAAERIATALGHDDGTFTTLTPTEPEWSRGENPYSYTIHSADLNGDGLTDLLLPVAADSREGGVWALLSNGDGTFSGGVAGLEGADVWDVGAEDFNGDGRADIAALVAPAPGGGELELAVYDNTSEPELALGATALDLGATTLGQTTTRQVTITDGGNYGLSISSLTLGGANPADFKATGCTAVPISPGASCEVSVSFTPSAATGAGATLTIASDDPNHPTATVALSGTGTKPSESAGGSGTGGGSRPATPSPTAKLTLPRSAKVTAKGQVTLKLTCTGADCTGRLTLTASAKKKVKGKTRVETLGLGSVRYSVGEGDTKAVTLRLPAGGLRTLNAVPGRKLAAEVAIAPDGGTRSTAKLVLIGSKPPGNRK